LTLTKVPPRTSSSTTISFLTSAISEVSTISFASVFYRASLLLASIRKVESAIASVGGLRIKLLATSLEI
jgi:hypothetical protein